MIADARIFTELIAVRHGRTAANNDGRLQGHYDSPLDAEGRQQAALLARRLRAEHFDAFYSSDLIRAVDTAAIIGRSCRLHPEPMPELREWDMGELENCGYDDLRLSHPEIMTGFKFDAAELNIPGGESKRAFYRRIATVMDTLAARHPGKRILVVTHGGVLQAMLKYVLGGGNTWNFLPRSANVSYNLFLLRREGWQLGCWNDTSHVNGLADPL
ncbi:MAG: histidine phosphatase family protein [Victivallales bacterium]|nr:histidine phosphatase family protein [Victivallales bacterium]